MKQFIFIFLGLLHLSLAELRVVGNLAVVATPLGHVGTEGKVLKANVPSLWCSAHNLGEEVTISYGQFTRLRDGKEFPATLKGNKAYLEIGKASVNVAGKYRCEVRTEDGEVITGNSFIYLPPVLRLSNETEATEVKNARPPLVQGKLVEADAGSRLKLLCPAFSYPQSFVRWEKDGNPVDTEQVDFDGDDLIIEEVTTSHAGAYKCIADNSFPLFVDGPAMPHSVVYEQKIDVK